MKRLGLFVLWLLLAAPAFAALTFPALSGRVVDEAKLLTPAQRNAYIQMLAEHESKTGNQVVIVTLKSLQGQEIEEYGYKLGRAWGIGQKDKNNGVLFIIAPKEHRVRIEVGYGLEGQLTDAMSSAIIQQSVLPYFKTDDYAGGIQAGTSAILSILEGKPVSFVQPQSGNNPDQTTGDVSTFIIILVIVIIVFLRFFGGRGGGGGFIGGGGFGGRGGGFNGGGGSFGGGGSSGRW